jgi:magnesium chelatase family protein
MLAKVTSAAVLGLESVPVTVEVDVSSQSLPAFTIVGLPDKAVEESKERVRSALKNSGAEFPPRRITVNLAPAALPKEGPSYDLPIALGLLVASGQLEADLSDALVLGELSLDGSLRHVSGILPTAILAKEKKIKRIFLPKVNAREAAIISGLEAYPTENLSGLVKHLSGHTEIKPHRPVKIEEIFSQEEPYEFDFSEIRGQEKAKRALEIAAAGGHNILMKGPPGSGKTLLSRSLPSILPKLTFDEALEVTKIYSVCGLLGDNCLVKTRPFRSPHHTASHIGLVGGGNRPAPGEISLAHRGVLFLDELPEFPRHVLESLRQPLEDGWITVSRAAGSVKFPSKFILVGAQNPCPCGWLGDPKKECICAPASVTRYQKRISGPLLDRIDIHLEVPHVKVEKLTGEDLKNVEDSKTIRARVQKARDIQTKRFTGRKTCSNGEMTNKEIKEFCKIDDSSKQLIRAAITQMGLTARGYMRVLKLARTIADLDNSKEIKPVHIAEALQYRPRQES